MRYLEQSKSRNQKVSWWWTVAGEEEHGELLSDSYRASVLQDGRVMGMGGGDDCTMI